MLLKYQLWCYCEVAFWQQQQRADVQVVLEGLKSKHLKPVVWLHSSLWGKIGLDCNSLLVSWKEEYRAAASGAAVVTWQEAYETLGAGDGCHIACYVVFNSAASMQEVRDRRVLWWAVCLRAELSLGLAVGHGKSETELQAWKSVL